MIETDVSIDEVAEMLAERDWVAVPEAEKREILLIQKKYSYEGVSRKVG